MLKVSASKLIDEIDAAEVARADKLKYLRRMRAGYASPDANGTGECDYENVAFSMISLMQPMMAFGYPVHDLSSTRGPELWPVVEGFRIGLDRVCRDIEIPDIYEAVGLDMLFGWGVALVTREPVPGDWEPGMDGEVPHRPAVYRIAPENHILDHRALTLRECRYMGHRWAIDKEDLMELAEKEPHRWNRATIEALISNQRDENPYRVDPDVASRPERDTVHLYDIWVPETGELYTLPAPDSLAGTSDVIGGGAAASDAQKGHVCKPRKYVGPRSGPYVIFGQYMVPSSPWPLASLVANNEQARVLNERVKRQVLNAKTRRQYSIVKGDDEFAAEIENAPHRTTFARSAFDNTQVSTLSVGGADPAEYEAIAFERDLLYRNLGFTEEMRGLNSSDTATSSSYANNSAMQRLTGVQQKFKRGCGQMSRKMLSFMLDDDEVVIPLGDAGLDAFGIPNLWVTGGDAKDLRIEDFELSINVGSSQRQNEMVKTQRLAELLMLAGNMAQQSKLAPEFDWAFMWQTACRNYEMRELENALDPEMLELAQQVALQGAVQPGQAVRPSSGGGNQPQRMAGDAPRGRTVNVNRVAPGRESKGVSPSGGSQPKMSGALELD